MILFVDNEHEWGYSQPWGDMVAAMRMKISYRLEDISGDTCLLQRWHRVTPELVERHDIRAMFISGSGAHKDEYDVEAQAGLREVIRSVEIPMFGFCGGFQLMFESLGAPLELVGPIPAGEDDPTPDYAPGLRKEVGYMPVTVTDDHPVTAGLGAHPIFRQFHSWEITAIPDGFSNYASSDVTANQLVVGDDRPVMGTQFHPEYFTDEHPDGRTLIANFCRWAGLM